MLIIQKMFERGINSFWLDEPHQPALTEANVSVHVLLGSNHFEPMLNELIRNAVSGVQDRNRICHRCFLPNGYSIMT